ncbi:MAG: multidrug efflux protein [Gammaproteobacteria bacterium RIFCSPHIGHO2_12_FULL_42_13]|nr:MAG: multidrug efflux protein [Gammaproteobacteria bacterium RIFCSPHIGHO2_12_FULL_42_13]
MNKRFTDIFISRPVLATVVSLLIFVVGLRAIFELPVRQYPEMENTVITVTTGYPGASSQLIQGFITTPLEKEIASAGGIDYLTSQSTDGLSTITANIILNYDPNDAFTNIMSKVAQAKYVLPTEAEDPVIKKMSVGSFALLYISFNSPDMTSEQITDYITRVVQPKIETVDGVSQAEILGGNSFAMRIWLDPSRMAALGVSPTEVRDALLANNIQTAAGTTRGKYIQIGVIAATDVHDAKAFENLIIKQSPEKLVRLRDVARVELGSQSYGSSVYFNGKKATFMAVDALPDANPLTVISKVRAILPDLEKNFPPSLHANVVFDATKFIHASLVEVIKTIVEATIIVVGIIFLFLGSVRSVSIPVVTIPLSLIGVFGIMLIMNYSINLLTLLALVLAIGMVVDDAIVVVENIHRHIEEGMSSFDAAVKGAREIAFPVIAMTLTLAAVYAPIAFMSGITGALFKEFALTLAGSVILSGVIALTLSPMMCSHVLNQQELQKPMAKYVDDRFTALKNSYEKILTVVLAHQVWIMVFAAGVLVSSVFLYLTANKELAPVEDQGVVWIMGQGPQSANINYTEVFTNEINQIFPKYPALDDYFIINGWGTENTMGSGFLMKPWGDRKISAQQLSDQLNQSLSTIAGLQLQAITPPSLPSPGFFPIEFVVDSVQPMSMVFPLAQQLMEKAMQSGLFMFLVSDVKYDKPQASFEINREKAAEMGITMQAISDALTIVLGGNYINRFPMEGYAYQVIPQLDWPFRKNAEQLQQVYVKSQSGALVPLADFVTMKYQNQPNQLMRFQQLNAVTLQGMMMPGNTVDQGLSYLRDQANQLFPTAVGYDYGGSSRQFMQEGNTLMLAFMFSIIFIFLVLAAQFESFRDPLVVMLSVPMAICGALLPLNWGLASINIYTQVGLITLVGLISKHGILMVDFANHVREDEQCDRRQAIIKAASIRLRPILMTTAAMILGVVPLLIAKGAGAASRFDIGLVIASGMGIGTLFTLFVVPVMYTQRPRNILVLLAIVAMVVMSLLMVTGYV